MMKLVGKKVLFLIGPEFEDLEFWVPLMRLREEGADVVIAGAKAGETYYGKHGVPGISDISFEQVNHDDYLALVIPGGWAPDKLRRDSRVKRLLQEMYSDGKIIAMICHAGLIGISAGIVDGHNATGSVGIKDDLINAGAYWMDVPALRSKNLVWGRVVADIPDFCRELIHALTEEYQ